MYLKHIDLNTICRSEDTFTEETEQQKLFIADLIYFTGSCYSCNSGCKNCRLMNFTQQVEKVSMTSYV